MGIAIKKCIMLTKKISLAAATLFALVSSVARAEVVLLDKDDWKFGMSGFVEFDGIGDSTSSFTEVVGNAAVKATGYDANVGRTQFSMRNSRFALNVLAPENDGVKSRGYLEMDFLGYDPAPTDAFAGGAANSEGSYYTNPTLRIRHAYMSSTSGKSQLLVGQYWSLFGWQPTYVLTTVSVAPVSGTVYERTPQITYTYTTTSSENHQLVAAASVSRPNQRASGLPNFEAGLKWSCSEKKSGFASANSDIKNVPMSVGLSGALRDYTTPTNGADAVQTHHTASAVAIDAQVPLITAKGDSPEGSLTLTAEYTTGEGYGDQFPSWGGTPALSNAAATPYSPNLDKGLAGYDSNLTFTLVKLDSANVQLQYHLAKGYFDVGYGLLHSSNASGLGASATTYDRAESTFVNYFHNCTKQIRVGLEYAQFRTRYNNNGATSFATDTREMLATYYRF